MLPCTLAALTFETDTYIFELTTIIWNVLSSLEFTIARETFYIKFRHKLLQSSGRII